jgi:hypothetical protein
MSFRREALEALGGFRSEVGRVGSRPSGCEETELCIRAAQRWPERRLVYDPSARVTHRVPASRSRWRYFVARCFAEGRSKAVVTALVGGGDGLSSERSYVRRVLPAGVVRSLAGAVTGRDREGWRRAAAIVAGLAVTGTGYLTGLAAQRGRSST